MRRSLRSLLVVALVVLVAVAIFFRPIETEVVRAALGWATGDAVRIASVENEAGGIVLVDASIATPEGSAQLAVSRAELAVRGARLVATLVSPRATVTVDRIDATDLARGNESLARFGGGRALGLHVEGGSLVLVAADRPEMRVALDGIAGDASFANGVPSYDLALSLVAGDARFPISANAHAGDDGVVVQRLSANRIPLDALETLHLFPSLALRGGSLDDVVASCGASVHAVATLDGVALALLHAIPTPAGDLETTLAQSKADPPTPPLDNDPAPTEVSFDRLRGQLTIDGDAIGSPGIAGRLDGVPFGIRGNVRGLASPLALMNAGAPGLQQIGKLAGMIGAQRHLTFARIETAAPGVAFAQFGLTSPLGPHVVSLVGIDPKEPTLHFDTALSADKIISKGERTSDLGTRTNAVAGLNGDYFDIGRTYEPQGMLMRGGALLHGPADRASVVIDRNGNATFAEFHLGGAVVTKSGRFPVTQVNSWPTGATTIITPDYGATLPPEPDTTFVRLDPVGSSGTRYRVRSVEPATSALPVSFGVAFGARVKGPLPHVGEHVDARYSLVPAVPNAFAGIGGGPILLKDGEWYEDPHAPAPDERDVRWPVDALGKLADGSLVMVAVDGRHPERSVGMTRPEFGALLQTFGVTDAMALDSGGSVTLVARLTDGSLAVRNKPSDDSAERYIADAIFVYSSALQRSIADPANASASPLPDAATDPQSIPTPAIPNAPSLAVSPSPVSSALSSPKSSPTP